MLPPPQPRNARLSELYDDLHSVGTPGVLRTPSDMARLDQLVHQSERKAKVLMSEKTALYQELEVTKDRAEKLQTALATAEKQRDLARKQLRDAQSSAATTHVAAGHSTTDASSAPSDLQTQLGEANSLINKLETDNASLTAQVSNHRWNQRDWVCVSECVSECVRECVSV